MGGNTAGDLHSHAAMSRNYGRKHMRRTIMAVAASAGLALSAAGLALAGPVSAAAAATTTAARPATADTTCVSNIQNPNSGEYLNDQGQGNLVTMSYYYSSCYVALEDGSSKWYELKDAAGGNQCLDLVGLSGGGYGVNTETCNFRSAELWWLTNEEIINQYGTKLLDHDGCLWDSTSGIAPTVQDCVASQPLNQLWTYSF